MSKCDDKQDEFLKNEYILNLNELIMIRNYTYKEKTFQKYRLTDLSVKKSNSYVRNIYVEDGKILKGINAFSIIWREFKYFKYLSFFLDYKIIKIIARPTYNLLVKIKNFFS